MWDKIKQHWIQILEVLGAIIGFFLVKDKLQEGLKAKLKNADTNAKSQVLDEKESKVSKDLSKEQVNNDSLRSKLNQSVSQDEQQALDYWRNNK